VRATKPNEFWHVDVTLVRLLNGTRVYLHAVIDNFSRRILAWKLAERLEPQNTCAVLARAGELLPPGHDTTTVVADSGVENVNRNVDALLEGASLRRVLAQVEVAYSNSLIEAFWKSLKHGWLYLNHLDSFAAVERLVAFYVTQHNSVLPHAAFAGQTPDEVFFGKGDDVPAQLAQRRAEARHARLEANRNVTCGTCESPRPLGDSPMISGLVHLHPPNSTMS
jgi:transposase InsO family protein